MPKCNFNKFAMQLYWNRTLTWVFSCQFAAYFQNTFHRNTSGWLSLKILNVYHKKLDLSLWKSRPVIMEIRNTHENLDLSSWKSRQFIMKISIVYHENLTLSSRKSWPAIISNLDLSSWKSWPVLIQI